MSYINIKFKNDFRGVFKKDECINIEMKSGEPFVITGDNGSGKSTLIDLIRAHKCNNGESKSLNQGELEEIKDIVEFDTDFENIFIIAPQGFDDPMSMMNTYDAVAFVEMGGFHASRLSNGQRHNMALAKFINQHKAKFNEKTLIIFDEVDTGLDLKSQALHSKLIAGIGKKTGATVVNVTHSMLVMMKSKNVWSMNDRDYVDIEKYIENIL